MPGENGPDLVVELSLMSQVAYARKEIAFAKWKASGYRDHAAHSRFLYWFEICQSLLRDRHGGPVVEPEPEPK